jgi:hypothetical protein
MTEVNVEDVLKRRELTSIRGERVLVPDPRLLVHLQSAGMRDARSAICM